MSPSKATRLEDIYKSVSNEPLVNKAAFEAFYCPEINALRGQDKVGLMKLGLGRAWNANPYKAFVMGHSGVGKSTELTRLVNEVNDKYDTIRLSATRELDPTAFQPFDVLLLMMAELTERTAQPIQQSGSGSSLPDERLREIWDWFAAEEEITKRAVEIAARAEAGAGVKGGSLLGKVLGLYASLKGEAKYASTRETKTVHRRLSRLSDLIELANHLIQDCNIILREETGREWLFIMEDFDKAGIPLANAETLFVTYGNVFKNLFAHMIFVIPIALGYSSKSVQFPVPSHQVHCITDTPVFTQEHKPHRQGREAIRKALEARVDPKLFAKAQLDLAIAASGGNLRDLFALIADATDNALVRGAAKIESADLSAAVNKLRSEYERRLGESPYETESVGYPEKAKRLAQIYQGDPEAKVPNPTLYSLLYARAVQEFNGERWFGVHPLVVDLLVTQKRLKHTGKGAFPGGTR